MEVIRKLPKWEKHFVFLSRKNSYSSNFSTVQLRNEQGCVEFWMRQVMLGTSWMKKYIGGKAKR